MGRFRRRPGGGPGARRRFLRRGAQVLARAARRSAGTRLCRHSPKNKRGGATLTGLLGTSAWYAPGAAGAALVEAIVRDQKKIMPCCVYLDGEYGQTDICIGVPVIIGKNGWEKIIDYKLNDEEMAAFAKSADVVRNMNSVLSTLDI